MKCTLRCLATVVVPLFLLLLFSFQVFAQSSCYFTVRPSTLHFDYEGGTEKIMVQASSPGCRFAAVSKYPWISVSQGEGTEPGMLTVRVEGNTNLQHRVGSIKIDGAEVDVVQEGPVILGDF